MLPSVIQTLLQTRAEVKLEEPGVGVGDKESETRSQETAAAPSAGRMQPMMSVLVTFLLWKARGSAGVERRRVITMSLTCGHGGGMCFIN